jgi:hypothetical protein
MALPKQVEQQLKEIEALEKQLMGEIDPPSQENPAPDPEPPAEPSEPKPNENPAPEVPEETWQQKYKTLKGMYDAEVPRLHAQVKELQTFVAQLKQQAEAKPDPVQTTKTPSKRETLVTDEEVEAFGKDLIDVQRKVAREVAMEFKEEIDALRAENSELRKQMQQTDSQIGEVSFEQRLYHLVPDWSAINADPKWVAWLDEFDPMLRAPRRAAAQGAYNASDAEGVAYYVNMFKDAHSTPAVDQRQAELERQVQPTRSATSQTPVSQKGKTYTTRDVEKMFLKVKDLNIAHKYDDAKKLEAEIDAAYMEGRVTA